MLIRALGLATVASVLTVPAFAAEPNGQSVRVEYNDLNLATAEGQEMLDRRLDAAARQVCGIDDVQTGTRIGSRDAKRCYRDAKASLQAQFADLVQARTAG